MIAETKEKKDIMEKKRMLDSACFYKRLADVLKKKKGPSLVRIF